MFGAVWQLIFFPPSYAPMGTSKTAIHNAAKWAIAETEGLEGVHASRWNDDEAAVRRNMVS